MAKKYVTLNVRFKVALHEDIPQDVLDRMCLDIPEYENIGVTDDNGNQLDATIVKHESGDVEAEEDGDEEDV